MLEINLEFRRGILFIRLNGILNKETSIELTRQINRFIKENGIKYFTFNLEGLKELGEEAIDIIRENYQQIVSFNGKLVLCGLKDKKTSTILQDLEQSNNELGVFQIIRI